MSFINESDLKAALKILFERGLNTIDTSALVYFFALSKILIEDDIESVTLDNGTEGRDKFIDNVRDLIEIDNIHIWHPLKVVEQEANWNKNKSVAAFVSSNLLTTAYNREEAAHPKKSPILSFKDRRASLHSEYLESVSEILSKYDYDVLRSICIWLLRKNKFENDISNAKEISDKVNSIYGFEFDLSDSQENFTINTSADEVTSLNILFEFIRGHKDKKRRKVLEHHGNSSLSILYKPFLILAGISGTGKTRFVREQAKVSGDIEETYRLIPVRPDWHEPSDLIGYVSRLDSKPRYIATDVLRFIVKAWREIIDSIEHDENGLPTDWCGKDLGSIRPFWLCLDEMNLAPVEQYFADYLSILETRCWNDPEKLSGSENDYLYECDPLIKGDVFTSLDADFSEQGDKPSTVLAKDLGFNLSDDLDQAIWGYFLQHGIGIPFNLIVAGTVNMDETTHGFSRKVIDRALSFDFGEFFPNDYAEFFKPTICNKALSYPVLSHANHSQDKLPSIDRDGQKSIDFLNAVNAVLDNTPFKLAYRALNELLLAVISEAPEEQDTLHLQAVWDDFLMCKVLPRIEGDSDKLMTDDSNQPLLQKLNECLATELSEIWNGVKDSDNARPDLYREKLGATGDDKILRIACRSKAKLEWMQKRLERSGFTSFWP